MAILKITKFGKFFERQYDRYHVKHGDKWLKRHAQTKTDIKTFVFAHRGSKCNRPENTLAAFREAVRVGSDGIELDVHLSADNELVVIHDEKINRTTNAKGLVRTFTLAQLKKFDAGSWFSSDFSGEHIPSLLDVLTELSNLKFTGVLNIEVKTNKFDYPGIEKQLSAQMTSQKWPFDYIYSSFNLKTLATLSKLETQTEISYLTGSRLKKIKRGLLTDFVTSIHPRKIYAFNHPAQAIFPDKPLRLWTVNSDQELRVAFEERVAGLITDFPEKALDIRAQIQKQQDEN